METTTCTHPRQNRIADTNEWICIDCGAMPHGPDCHLNQPRLGGLDLGCTCDWTTEDQDWLNRTTD